MGQIFTLMNVVKEAITREVAGVKVDGSIASATPPRSSIVVKLSDDERVLVTIEDLPSRHTK